MSAGHFITFPSPPREIRLRSGSTAEAEKQASEAAAYERGLADGERRLSQQLLEQRNEMLHLQNGVLASLQRSASDVIRQSQEAVTQLAFLIAEKIVGQLPVTESAVEHSVKEALAQVEKATEFLVELNPEDLALLQKSGSPLLSAGEGSKKFEFQGAANISRGGCMVHTHFGVIDARRETRWELVLQALNG
jgi:flagellar assembly protein FliH